MCQCLTKGILRFYINTAVEPAVTTWVHPSESGQPSHHTPSPTYTSGSPPVQNPTPSTSTNPDPALSPRQQTQRGPLGILSHIVSSVAHGHPRGRGRPSFQQQPYIPGGRLGPIGTRSLALNRPTFLSHRMPFARYPRRSSWLGSPWRLSSWWLSSWWLSSWSSGPWFWFARWLRPLGCCRVP